MKTVDDIKDILVESGKMDFESVFDKFINKSNIERISRIQPEELDRICQMLYFGIRHTALLNKKDINFSSLNNDQGITGFKKSSAILDYTLINLSLRLSLDSKSREELRDVFNHIIEKEIRQMKEEEVIQNAV